MVKNLGEKITVRLRNKLSIEGKLVAFDEHLNLMMEDAAMKR
jgi:small nuclear ribonucleoprotein (snRNP)-like protein